jgi:phage-related protein
MDARGGTITWFLTANDADFNAAMVRTRSEARQTGRVVDREFGRGLNSARLSLDDFRRDLNRSAQVFRDFQIALRGFELTSLIVGATLAGGAIIELVGALTAATGAIYAAPGIIAPVIGAFGTLQTATYGVSDAFKAVLKGDMKKLAEEMDKLSPKAQEFVTSFGRINEAFKPIRTAVQDAFFDNLGKQMESVASVILPVLEAGMLRVAKSMNGLTQEAARVAKEPFFQSMIAKSLETTSIATDTLTKAVEPLASAVAGLVQIGLPYTNMLAEWVVSLSESASGYINSAEGQKRLTDSINLGIEALQKLGDLVGSVFDLFIALFRVSNQEGVSLIGTLTQIIDKMTEWVNSAEGQEKMTALFQAANTVFVALSEVVGTVLDGILGLIKAYNDLNGPLKDFITNFVVFAAVASPLLTYVSSIGSSLKLIGLGGREAAQAFGLLTGIDIGGKFKAIEQSGGLLNGMFKLLSKNPLLAAIGLLVGVFIYLGTQTTIFQDAFKQLQPVFEKTWEALQPLFGVLGQLAEVLGGAIASIVPVIAQVFGELLAALLPLVPPILDLVMTLLPVLVQVLQFVVGVIQVLMPIITFLAQVIGAILVVAINILVAVLQVVIGVIQWVADIFVWGWNLIVSIWNGAGAFFGGIWDAIVLVFSVVVAWFGDIFKAAWEGIQTVWNAVAGFFQGVWDGIVKVFNVVGGWFADNFQKAWDGITKIWDAVGDFFKGIWTKITGAFSGAVDLGKNIIDGLVKGISSANQAVVNKIKEIAAGALNAIKDFFGIKSPSRVMAKVGGNIMAGLGLGIDREGSAVVSSARTAAEGVLDAFSGMQTGIGKIGTDFSISGNSTATTDVVASLAPGAIQNQSDIGSATAGAVIYQTNEVHTDLDMDQVNRNLSWELSKI